MTLYDHTLMFASQGMRKERMLEFESVKMSFDFNEPHCFVYPCTWPLQSNKEMTANAMVNVQKNSDFINI